MGETDTSGTSGTSGQDEIRFEVSDPAQLSTLQQWLRQGPADVRITPGVPGPGEQGAADLLSVLAGSSGLVAAIKILPEFIRSRRTGFHIETTVRGEKFVIDATNAEAILPVIEKLLGE